MKAFYGRAELCLAGGLKEDVQPTLDQLDRIEDMLEELLDCSCEEEPWGLGPTPAPDEPVEGGGWEPDVSSPWAW